ncbi:MAG: twin transmembrane helix small protein [Pseudomonadota bacterium]|nr:twin transmembrane helix small protein [Pseudomonadota bacterium]
MSAVLYFKIYIFLLLILICASLASGLFFLAKDNSTSKRLVTSLTFRIILSILLFVSLIIGFRFGWITPHGPNF